MASIPQFLQRLSEHGVEFVVVGGVAANFHGSTHGTLDLDVAAPLDEPNLRRIVAALCDLHPKFRMHPSKPALFDVERLVGFRNLNLDTDWGVIDILGEISGVGTYADVVQNAVSMRLGVLVVRVLDLPALIQAKKTANRPKDLHVLPELEYILQQRQQPPEEH